MRLVWTAVSCCFGVGLTGCSVFLENVEDPGQGVPVASIIKSLRCEMITFFVANRMRRQSFLANYKSDFQGSFANFAFLDLDDNEYGSIQADLKTIDTFGLSVGIDRKFPYGSVGQFSKTWHVGPAYNQTTTYTRTNIFALPQDSTLGPTTDKQRTNQLYGDPTSGDADFFCYLRPYGEVTKTVTLDELESLVRHQRPEFENFHRIWVGGELTLSEWLERMGTDMAKNNLATGPYQESILPGQINYSFSLDVKPSFDLKYTLVSSLYSPLVPDLSISKENTSTFSIFLNTKYAKAAYGGKNGTANLDQPPKDWVVVAEKKTEPPPRHRLVKQAPSTVRQQPFARPQLPAPSLGPSRSPGVSFPAPLAIPAPQQ
jgi:hypothetical protein